MDFNFINAARQVQNSELSQREKVAIVRRFVAKHRDYALSLLLFQHIKENERLHWLYKTWQGIVRFGILAMCLVAFIILVSVVNISLNPDLSVLIFVLALIEAIMLAVVVSLEISCRHIINQITLSAMESWQESTYMPMYVTWHEMGESVPHGNEQMSWDEIVAQCYDANLDFDHEVVDVFYNMEEDRRSVILKRKDGNFILLIQRLYPYEEDEITDLPGYWGSDGSGGSIVDSVGLGRKIAEEVLGVSLKSSDNDLWE